VKELNIPVFFFGCFPIPVKLDINPPPPPPEDDDDVEFFFLLLACFCCFKVILSTSSLGLVGALLETRNLLFLNQRKPVMTTLN
jgi:hypothetical protein